MSEFDDIVKITAFTDDNRKQLGEIIANNNSWSILKSIHEKPNSPSNLSKVLDIDLTLVSRYLDKMLKLGLLTKKEIKTKRGKIIYTYYSKRLIILAPSYSIKNISESKNILRSLKRIFKISSIIIASAVSGIVGYHIQNKPIDIPDSNGTIPFAPPMPPLLFDVAIILSIIVLCIGFGSILLWNKYNKKIYS